MKLLILGIYFLNEWKKEKGEEQKLYYSYVHGTTKTIKCNLLHQISYTIAWRVEKAVLDIKGELRVLNEEPLHDSEVPRRKNKGYLLIDGIIEEMEK